MKRKQFTFYRSFLEAMRKLPDDLWLAYLVNIVCYGLDEELPMEMNYIQEGMFELVKPTLDSARKKAEAGAAGGRVSKASKQVSKREKEKEIEIEIENEIEIEIERESVTRAEFERFWNLYPMKIGKEDAWAAWQEKMPDGEAVCANLELWLKSKQWVKDGSAFIPRAAKFLEQEYYRQKPEVAAPVGALGQLGQAEMEALEKIMREEIK